MKTPRAKSLHEPWCYDVVRIEGSSWDGDRSCDITTEDCEFTYQRLGDPKLKALRRKYRLDQVVAEAGTEFDTFVALKQWVHEQIPNGVPDPTAYWDSLSILNEAGKGGRFYCVFYSLVFIQCCQSLGYQGRMVQMWRKEKGGGHTMAEVWSNTYRKWVLFDCQYNVHFVVDGLPLGALDMHRLWLRGEWRKIHERPKFPSGGRGIRYNDRDDFEEFETDAPKLSNYFSDVRIIMSNDFFAHPMIDRPLLYKPLLHWCDERTPPLANHRNTSREEVFNWPLNQVRIGLDLTDSSKTVSVHLDTKTPDLRHYLVRIEKGDWDIKPNRFRWSLRRGKNHLEAKMKNELGVEGPASRVVVELAR